MSGPGSSNHRQNNHALNRTLKFLQELIKDNMK